MPASLKPKPLWTGNFKQILAMSVPRGINIRRSPNSKSSNPVFDDAMLIENSSIIYGIVEKKTVGASKGGFLLREGTRFDFFALHQSSMSHQLLALP